jgi:uncharacterized protein (TIGR03382 family)
MGKGFAWLTTGTLALLAACGPGAAELTSGQIPILGGQQVAEGEYLEVVLVNAQDFMCSGTLITPRVVLTAAHCLDFPGLLARQVVVRFGESQIQSSGILAGEFLIHPDWDSDALLNDLALIRLERNAPIEARPVPHLPQALELTGGDVGADLLFVGFGVNSWGGSGIKMQMNAALQIVCTRTYGCHYAKPNTICIDQEPTGICSGDSGGPAFVERDGVRYVAGVNSYTSEGCQYFGCATKVDEFQAFIDDFVGAADGTACELDDECASRVCSDGVCCDQDCDGLCQACDLPGQEGTCGSLPDGTRCDDGDHCNGQETCQAGSCEAGQALVCEDAIGCTRDLCDPKTGCVFPPSILECFDDNPCTDDLCDPQSGCQHTALPDGTVCDLGSTCAAGLCVASASDDGCGCGHSGASSGLAWLGLVWLGLRRRRR